MRRIAATLALTLAATIGITAAPAAAHTGAHRRIEIPADRYWMYDPARTHWKGVYRNVMCQCPWYVLWVY